MAKKKSTEKKETKVSRDEGEKGIIIKPGWNPFECRDCGNVYKSKNKDNPQCGRCKKRNSAMLSMDPTEVHKEKDQKDTQITGVPTESSEKGKVTIKVGSTPMNISPEIMVEINKLIDAGYGNSPEDILSKGLSSFYKLQTLGGNNMEGLKSEEIFKIKQQLGLSPNANMSEMMNAMLQQEMMFSLLDRLKGNSGNNQFQEFLKKQEDEKKQEALVNQLNQLNQNYNNQIAELKRTIELSQASGKQLSPTDIFVQLNQMNQQHNQEMERIRLEYSSKAEKSQADAEIAKANLINSQLQDLKMQMNQHNGINTGQFSPNIASATTQIASLKDTISAVKEVAKEFTPQVKEESTIEQAGKVLGQAIEQINPTVIAPIGAAIANKIASSGNKTAQLPTSTPSQTEEAEIQEPSLTQISTGD